MAGEQTIVPFAFDPESDPEAEAQAVQQQTADQQRLQQNVSEWCQCGICEIMPTERENRCCMEIPQVTALLGEVAAEPACMLDHPGFEPVCLNVYSLQTAGRVYRHHFGSLRLRRTHRRFRYLAYRQFVAWCWGFLGRRIRVVIPACVVLRIRAEYPDDEGHCTGFRLPRV
ncbi:P2X purinoceptor 7-like [Odontesthes bonariensis]|uniref:P2X purinoceptor 7-like n=2 Tax=Odontesthes bonariensis TaxID=219752 RepID=UPI003F589FB8